MRHVQCHESGPTMGRKTLAAASGGWPRHALLDQRIPVGIVGKGLQTIGLAVLIGHCVVGRIIATGRQQDSDDNHKQGVANHLLTPLNGGGLAKKGFLPKA